MPTQRRNDEQVGLLKTDYQMRYEPNFAWKSAVSTFQALPGLRGFWPMSAFGSTGQAFDQSGNVRTLTYNGNPTYGQSNLFPYIELDGTGDYLSRLDEAGLDILGTETYVEGASRGLTMGGWFKFDSLDAVSEQLISKLQTGVQGAYYMYRNALSTVVSFSINSGGANVSSSIILDTTNWFFCVSRYVPSTTVDLYVNGTKDSAATAIAAIVNLPDQFVIGGETGGLELFDGKISMVFLCAAALSDAIIGSLFQQTRAMFNV